MSDNNDQISIEQFLDDFFAESDEHLTALRRLILDLERQVGQLGIDRRLLDDLFRRFHTLKGLSGMVGLEPAEKLAHQMESYLRNLRQGATRLSGKGLAALMSGISLLERIIASKKEKLPSPEIRTVMDQLASLEDREEGEGAGEGPKPLPAVSTTSPLLNHEALERIRKAREDGRWIWNFEFTPSSELAERGVSVNAVRARLEQTGELIQASPMISREGGISFVFIVAVPEGTADFSDWIKDGISFSAYEERSVPVEAELSPGDSLSSADNPAGPPTIEVGAGVAPSNVIRVDLHRLEDLMQMVGGLVISRARLDGRLKKMAQGIPAQDWQDLQEINQVIERQLRTLREGVMRIRMVPMGDIFTRMQFVIRDLARESGKKVRLELSGQETEIDKFVVEKMMDPLLHLVRNAISHGLEGPEERLKAGKPEEGSIRLQAFTAGDVVIVEIADDGRGLDLEMVLKKARHLGMVSEEERPDAGAILDILCEPGFSTREEADLGAGRGVGMAVVKKTVGELGGTLSMDSQPGQGLRFTIELPLTLAIVDALIVKAGEQTFAVPQPSVREVIEVDPEAVIQMEKNEVFNYRGLALPLIRLARFFNLPESTGPRRYALVIGAGLGAAGLLVDRIFTRREIVVRALTDPLVLVDGISGATELGDGKAVLILDASGLVRAARTKKI
jgi:two-component system chemotaxis sensor kinase CheA